MEKIVTQFSTTFHSKIAPEYHYLFTGIQILEKNLALALIFTLKSAGFQNLYAGGVIMIYSVSPI